MVSVDLVRPAADPDLDCLRKIIAYHLVIKQLISFRLRVQLDGQATFILQSEPMIAQTPDNLGDIQVRVWKLTVNKLNFWH